MGARQKKSKKRSGTKAEQLLEDTTFVTDECLADSVPDRLRENGWRVEKHLDHFPRKTQDVDWLPRVGELGWVSINKDKAIRRKPWELDRVIACGVRMFTLSSGSMTAEQMVEIILANRLRIGRMLRDHPEAFVAVISRSGVELVRSASQTQPTEPTDESAS
jgi:hypothetical protein